MLLDLCCYIFLLAFLLFSYRFSSVPLFLACIFFFSDGRRTGGRLMRQARGGGLTCQVPAAG
jgi:hypothetical protein